MSRQGSVLELLEQAFAASDQKRFEDVLYAAVKSAAYTTCLPKVATAEDAAVSLSSQSINETSSEAELVEYNRLLESIFADFEAFLANAFIANSGGDVTASVSGSLSAPKPSTSRHDTLDRLAERLSAVCPKVRTPCGRIFEEQEPTFRCKDCSTDATCAFCRSCFFASIHAKHRYKMHASGGGYCDCGDEEAWTSGAWCRIHSGEGDEASASNVRVLRTIADEQSLEMKRVQSVLSKLPEDLVRRCDYLLQPLINTASLVLFQLLQGSARTDCLPLSTVPSDTKEVEQEFDKPSEDNNWPPGLNHLSNTAIEWDATQLGLRSFPRTCPRVCDAHSMEQRCLDQLARAHSLHPALFDITASSAAESASSVSSKQYIVVLYNNEFHNYEDVIRIVRRVDGCTSKQATLFAIIVNRDGRTPLLTNLTLQVAAQKAARVSQSPGSRHLVRPLRAAVMEQGVYAMENFFVSVLRWLERLAIRVLPLRPLVCNALLGRFLTSTEASRSASFILPPSEMMLPNSLLWHIFHRLTLSYRGVRKTASRLIASVLLQEPYHRRIFAIEFTRLYDVISQAYAYDDHLKADTLLNMTCQFYTVTSLARHLLTEDNALAHMISRLVLTVLDNSETLPGIYDAQRGYRTLFTQFCGDGLDSPSAALPTLLASRFRALRNANVKAWDQAKEAVEAASGGGSNDYLMTFHWRHSPIELPAFNPFERLLHTTCDDLHYLLTSLLNVRPLPGWWETKARKHFLCFFHKFLKLLCYTQDMNGLLRATQAHVEVEQEWISTFKMLSHLHHILQLAVQVASSDKELLLEAIKSTIDVFERRIAVIDQCFYVGEFDGPYTSPRDIDTMRAQCLGATSAVYDYDILTLRFSVMQPLPRLLAALFGHALEMGLPLSRIGFADKEFANLVIERPLQNIAFIAQCSANLWVRNGQMIRNIIYNMYEGLRAEIVDRDYQLLQQAAAVIPPDEFIVRLIHKLNLLEFMNEDQTSIKPGRIQFLETLLRTLLYLVTHRTTVGVGYFDPKVYASAPSSASLFPDAKLGEVDEVLEVNYGQLLDDVVHALCIKPMTHSKLLSVLPPQAPGCLLRKAPPYPRLETDASGSPSTWSGSWRDSVEEPLSRILQQVATLATCGTKRVYTIKPEVIVNRFNRFYYGYKQTEQTMAEEYVTRVLKHWSQKSGDPAGTRCLQLPTPPPLPRPRRRFVAAVERGLLQLVRCTTFVRLLRRLLGVAVVHNPSQSWWSETLTELVLHLIAAALYEDAITFSAIGRRPFLEAVARVSIERETPEELQRLAASRHWTKTGTDRGSDLELSTKNNCILSRLLDLQDDRMDPKVAHLAKWTVDLWYDVAAKPQDEAFTGLTAMEVENLESEESKKQQMLEAKQRRRAKIMAQMSKMQQKFIEKHFKEISSASDNDQQMETADSLSSSSNNYLSLDEAVTNASFTTFSALGPNRVEERISQVLANEKPLVTCVLCLDEVPEEERHHMVIAAYGSRSNVLSAPLPHVQAVDFATGVCRPDCTEQTLAGIATTAVAASIGSHEVVMTQLPYLLSNLTPGVHPGNNDGAYATQSSPSMTGSSQSSEPASWTKKSDVLDPWFQRPLISSRCPVGEEGTFISTCPHSMHATCKERYSERLKEQNDDMRQHRYSHRPPMYEFRCSLCRCLANFDFPVFERLQDSVPTEWLSRCLQRPTDLASWLRNLHEWLNESPKLSTSINLKVNFSITELSNVPESFSMLFGILTDSNAHDRDRVLEEICTICENSFSPQDIEEMKPGETRSGIVADTSEHRSRLLRPFGRRFLGASSSSLHEGRTTLCRGQQAIVPLLQFPRLDSFRVSENLWSFVKNLVHLSQPRPIECVQPLLANVGTDGPVNFMIMINNAEDAAAGLPAVDLDEADEDNDNNNLLDNETVNAIVNEPGTPALEVSATSLIMQAIVADSFRSLDREDGQQRTSGSSATAATALPPCVCEAVEELHTSLVSCYSHLLLLSGRLETTVTESSRRLGQAVSRLRAALVCTRRRSLQALHAAASAWRTLRHSIAYTLIDWERYLRLLGPRSHFFSSDMAERYKTGLCYLIRAAFHAHARLAPVSRGVFGRADGDGDTTRMRQWLLQRDDPEWWWWYCYFAPQADEDANYCCCSHSHTRKASHLTENVMRIAVTQDAIRLWRLLLPDSGSLCDLSSSPTCPPPLSLSASLALETLSQSPDTLGVPASLLWEADITHLFISLLFLRPGLEGVDQRVECQRVQLHERVVIAEAVGQLPDVACNEGFPRLPMGDSHEAFTLRLCYLALLVQTLLSWQPQHSFDASINEALREPCAILWMNDKLLAVRRRLQHLSGLPICTAEPTSQNLTHLFTYIHSRCLPFLRIAAFMISQITNLDVPPELSHPLEDKPSYEFSMLLAYLGLPQSPSDLLILLSDANCGVEEIVSPPCLAAEASASSSLWLASLMTSWCLLGRDSVSRSLYANQLLPTYLPPSPDLRSAIPLLPEPNINPPRLIQLPKEYVSLMALATELKSVHTGSNIHSDPSLCLVCGAVACFACYSCRRFETIPEMTVSSDNGTVSTVGRREAVVYDIQAHVRCSHSGYAMVMLFTGGVLLFSDQGRRTTELTSPYRDEFGEPDVGLRRGNPLFLNERAYEELNQMWLNHQMNSATSAKLYLIYNVLATFSISIHTVILPPVVAICFVIAILNLRKTSRHHPYRRWLVHALEVIG
ncbi:e3 ubiquitin protein ligase ubr2 [Echinococcus multilocularis]|uniref:E3 ubiquitin-protein ligase n=1 Tax=Echinococcus multilocularis TaxID=6211 RepID=A0A068Y346_ECHMU|nr:e3 ubiquitin protein ligase ubr2 [Echinococcus multilocularis]